jgi:drug/metabolite transporter (DMT)-like permease
MLIVDRPWTLPAPSAATVAALLGLALVSTALAYILYFRLLASAGATNLLLVTFLIPVSAILFGATLLGERLAARHFLGMALIGCGLAAIGRERAAAPPAACRKGQIHTCRLVAPPFPRSAEPSGGEG